MCGELVACLAVDPAALVFGEFFLAAENARLIELHILTARQVFPMFPNPSAFSGLATDLSHSPMEIFTPGVVISAALTVGRVLPQSRGTLGVLPQSFGTLVGVVGHDSATPP